MTRGDYQVFFDALKQGIPTDARINQLHFFTGGRLGALWQMAQQQERDNVHKGSTLANASDHWLETKAYNLVKATASPKEQKLRVGLAIAS
eukprot:6455041-Amphidinium_carterae.1